MQEKFKQAPFFKDYRKMLDELDKQIDAVTIGTPDHWHAACRSSVCAATSMSSAKTAGADFGEVDQMIAAAHGGKLVNQAMNQARLHSIRTFRSGSRPGSSAPSGGALGHPHHSCMDKRPTGKDARNTQELDWNSGRTGRAASRLLPALSAGTLALLDDYGAARSATGPVT